MFPEVERATISKQVTMFVANYCDKPILQSLVDNMPEVEKAFANALMKSLRGKSNSCSFEKTMYDMGNILKIMNLLGKHRKILLSEGIETRKLRHYIKHDLVHTLFMPFIPEDGYSKPIPMIREIFKKVLATVRDSNHKEKKETLFKKEEIKEKVHYDIHYCNYYVCLEGTKASLEEYLENVKQRLFRKYPELTTTRKVTEHRIGFGNLKFMCLPDHEESEKEETPEIVPEPRDPEYDKKILQELGRSDIKPVKRPEIHIVQKKKKRSRKRLETDSSELCHSIESVSSETLL